MKLTTLSLAAELLNLVTGLVPGNISVKRNISITHRAELLVDDLKLSIETGSGQAIPSPKDVQTAAKWDPENLANEADIFKYVTKGRWLGCLLNANDEDAGKAWPDPLGRTPKSASSQWTGTLENELRTWGWQEGDFDQDFCEWVTGRGRENIQTALEALGLSATSKAHGGDNVCHLIEHFEAGDFDPDDDEHSIDVREQHYAVNGQQYTCTDASYLFGINHIGGAILAMVLENPKHAAEHDWDHAPTDAELPQLRGASDIIFGYWLRNNPNPKNLRYYIVNDVHNDATMPLIATIMKERGHDKVPKWPGVTLGMWEREAEALLGCPMGSTLAHILLQHKADLGVKHVTEVTIFRDEFKELYDYPQVQLLYKIEDVPQPDQEMPDVDTRDGRVRHVVTRDEGHNMLRVHEFRVSVGVGKG